LLLRAKRKGQAFCALARLTLSSLRLALCPEDEFQSNRLSSGASNVRRRGGLRGDDDLAVATGRAAKAHAHETYAVRVRQRSGWLGARTLLGQVLSHRDALHPVRH